MCIHFWHPQFIYIYIYILSASVYRAVILVIVLYESWQYGACDCYIRNKQTPGKYIDHFAFFKNMLVTFNNIICVF
jgi:hypothetical protein